MINFFQDRIKRITYQLKPQTYHHPNLMDYFFKTFICTQIWPNMLVSQTQSIN